MPRIKQRRQLRHSYWATTHLTTLGILIMMLIGLSTIMVVVNADDESSSSESESEPVSGETDGQTIDPTTDPSATFAPATTVNQCFRNVRDTCNCGLWRKGSRCVTTTTKEICLLTSGTGARLTKNQRVAYKRSVRRFYRAWCRFQVKQRGKRSNNRKSDINRNRNRIRNRRNNINNARTRNRRSGGGQRYQKSSNNINQYSTSHHNHQNRQQRTKTHWWDLIKTKAKPRGGNISSNSEKVHYRSSAAAGRSSSYDARGRNKVEEEKEDSIPKKKSLRSNSNKVLVDESDPDYETEKQEETTGDLLSTGNDEKSLSCDSSRMWIFPCLDDEDTEDDEVDDEEEEGDDYESGDGEF